MKQAAYGLGVGRNMICDTCEPLGGLSLSLMSPFGSSFNDKHYIMETDYAE